MLNIKTNALIFTLILYSYSIHAITPFGESWCQNNPAFDCYSVKSKDSWSSLIPNDKQRLFVKRLNRINGFLKEGMVIARPKPSIILSPFSFTPFPMQDKNIQEKQLIVDETHLAFGAYDASGHLIHWGPISTGRTICPDLPNGCLTPKGSFHVLLKKGADCESNSLPKRPTGENGGGEMPYCVFFKKGYALHGSSDLPGYPASHGCVRLFKEDARWLNEVFLDAPSKGREGTLIFVR